MRKQLHSVDAPRYGYPRDTAGRHGAMRSSVSPSGHGAHSVRVFGSVASGEANGGIQ